jgi:transposase
MLVASIARRTLKLKRHSIRKVIEANGSIEMHLVPSKRSSLVCSGCGRRCPGYDTRKERRWTHVPLWGIPVVLVYAPRRVQCPQCGVVMEQIPWSRGKSPLSIALSMVLATWARQISWKVVASFYGLHWNTVRKAVQDVVNYGLAHRNIGDLLYIGVDEISRRRGHIYHTQVYDLVEKRLLWSEEGRKGVTLREFFTFIGPEQCRRIRAVCCDMWAPYIDTIKQMLPKVHLVFDKFHIVQHLGKAVDTVRKEEAARLKAENPELLKNTRYIWLKNPVNLTENQRLRLSDLEKLNLKVNRAYLLKEAFRKFWDHTSPLAARMYLDQWFWWATHSRLQHMRQFAWMIRRHQEHILNYFKVPIDNGAVEGLNNKAKAISHRAYGYRSAETFTLALLHGLGKLPEPPLTHRFV